MKFSKEQILALKISLVLFIFGFAVIYVVPQLRHSLSPWGYSGTNRYIFFWVFLVLTYFISYILAKITIRPLDEANIKLREYNHNLAHEIKTPLSVLLMNIELLEFEYWQHSLLTSSKQEIRSMEDITNALLFLSENNTLSSREKISFWDIIESYTDENIKVQKKGDFEIYGEKVLIERALKNLIENAQKYARKWTQIHIQISPQSFSVKNIFDGKINSEDSQKLLDVFYQGDNSRSDMWYGLWLSIVKKILDTHTLKYDILLEWNIFKFVIRK